MSCVHLAWDMQKAAEATGSCSARQNAASQRAGAAPARHGCQEETGPSEAHGRGQGALLGPEAPRGRWELPLRLSATQAGSPV